MIDLREGSKRLLNECYVLELSVGALFNNPAKRRLDYMEKVSAIVAIYKSEKFLPKLIDSIINQTWQNLEILLVDDGSPDNSGAIVIIMHREMTVSE